VEAPGYVFFGGRNRSPTDRPEHFAHANTARSLAAVWLAGDLAAERRMLAAAGVALAERDVDVPDRLRVTVATLTEGQVLLLPPSRSMIPGRPIVGVSVRVDDVAAARRALAAGGVTTHGGGNGRTVFVPPEAAHGLWFELRE
jgi:hypothetical protein